MKYEDIDLTQLTPEELECLRTDIDNEFHKRIKLSLTGDAKAYAEMSKHFPGQEKD